MRCTSTHFGLLSTLMLAGCSQAVTGPSTHVEDLPILWDQSGTHSHLNRPIRILARNRETLAQVPVTQVPVDFETQMVLIAGLGPTPSSDVGIRITRVWREGSRIRVQERQLHPGRDQEPGLNPASPWSLVIIPRSDLNVEGYSVQVPRGLISPSRGGPAGGAVPAAGSARRSPVP